jgi:hypothetical protein
VNKLGAASLGCSYNPQLREPDSTFHVFLGVALFLMLSGMFYPNREDSQEQLQEDLILLHEIYPSLNREQLLEAKENLDRYFDLAVRIFLRLEREGASRPLDPSKENPYDPDTKVDSPTHH